MFVTWASVNSLPPTPPPPPCRSYPPPAVHGRMMMPGCENVFFSFPVWSVNRIKPPSSENHRDHPGSQSAEPSDSIKSRAIQTAGQQLKSNVRFAVVREAKTKSPFINLNYCAVADRYYNKKQNRTAVYNNGRFVYFL